MKINLACSPRYPFNVEHQARNLWISTF